MPQMPIHSPRQNRVLAALPVAEYARVADDLELVTLQAGEILHESGDPLSFVYFPTTCIVSLIFSTQSGSSSELAMTGNDGLVGIPLVLRGETTTHTAAVQCGGGAYRLRAEAMRWELDQGGSLLQLSLGYAQALMTQMAQSVFCNRHHAVDQQLCRWFLHWLDLQIGNQIDVTQELIARMLGVRREAVTEAAGKLQAAGLIHYHRGHITVSDRSGLEGGTCECYGVVKAECDRLTCLTSAIPAKHRGRPNPATLRKRAEAQLKRAPLVVPTVPWDGEHLLHELRVHQIELEIHNEELRKAYEEADSLRRRYADLYDFAPIGYFTLNALGAIVDVNLAGAILLGIKSSQDGRHRFAAFVEPAFLDLFAHFLHEVLEAKCKKRCELVLRADAHRPAATVRIEAVADESGHECRMVVSDITAERRAGT